MLLFISNEGICFLIPLTVMKESFKKQQAAHSPTNKGLFTARPLLPLGSACHSWDQVPGQQGGGTMPPPVTRWHATRCPSLLPELVTVTGHLVRTVPKQQEHGDIADFLSPP